MLDHSYCLISLHYSCFYLYFLSDFPIPQSRGNKSEVAGIVGGVVGGAVCAIILLLGVLWWCGYLRRKDELGIYVASPNFRGGMVW